MLQLNNVKSGYNTGIINSNFQAIEDYLNNYVLNRDGVVPGEANQMNVHLDMNGKDILNVGNISSDLITSLQQKISQLEQRIEQLEGQ